MPGARIDICKTPFESNMAKKEERTGTPKKGRQPLRVRLPGFIRDEDVGLGDAVKRLTAAFGIRHCGACQRRAAFLNSRFVLTGRRK
jgi:hypothetical protein